MKKLRKIILYGHPSLRQPVSEAIVGAGETTAIANALRLRLTTIDGYGLTANQLGYDAQVFAYRLKERGKFDVILNPTITEYDDEMWNYREGCLSIPNFWWNIDRPRRVLLNGYDLSGEPVEIEAEDLQARIFQHEIDHFNGKLVIDHLDDEQRNIFKLEWYKMTRYLEGAEDGLQDNAE